MWYVRPAKAQTRVFANRLIEYTMIVKLLTETHLEFLSLIGGCTGLSESTLVKMQHCWESHVVASLLVKVHHVDTCINSNNLG